MSRRIGAISASVAVSVTKRTLPAAASSAHGNKNRLWRRLLPCLGFGAVAAVHLSKPGGAVHTAGTASSRQNKANSLASLRIFINYMFMTSLLTAFRLDWGATVRWLFAAESAVSGGMPPLLGCMDFGFLNQAKLMLASPLLLVVLVALAILAWGTFTVRCRGGKLELWGAPLLEVFRNALMAISFMLWPSFVGHVLRALDCSVEVGGVSYLASDVSVSCGAAEYKTIAAVASVYLYLLVPALPVALCVLLHRNQRHLDELSATGSMLAQADTQRFHQRYSFLFAGYEQRVWRWTPQLHGRSAPVQMLLVYIGSFETRLFVWWECVVMARKALLVGVTVWFARDPQFQVYAGLWVLLIAFILQVLCQPYSNAMTGFLETLTLGATLVTLLLGQALALGGLSDSTETFIRTLAALINVGMLCYFLRHALRSTAGAKGPIGSAALKRNSILNPMADGNWIRAAKPADADIVAQAGAGEPETDGSRQM